MTRVSRDSQHLDVTETETQTETDMFVISFSVLYFMLCIKCSYVWYELELNIHLLSSACPMEHAVCVSVVRSLIVDGWLHLAINALQRVQVCWRLTVISMKLVYKQCLNVKLWFITDCVIRWVQTMKHIRAVALICCSNSTTNRTLSTHKYIMLQLHRPTVVACNNALTFAPNRPV